MPLNKLKAILYSRQGKKYAVRLGGMLAFGDQCSYGQISRIEILPQVLGGTHIYNRSVPGER